MGAPAEMLVARALLREASAVCGARCYVGPVTGSDRLARYCETPSNLAFESPALKTTLSNVAGQLLFATLGDFL